MDGENLTVPDHLRSLLGAAAEVELEHATDGYWATDGDERAVARARLLQVARTAESWGAGACSREENREARSPCGPGMRAGPLTAHVGGGRPRVVRQAGLTRDLILFRDAVGGMPTQEELDEPV